MKKTLTATLLIAALAGASACGDDDNSSSGTVESSVTPSPTDAASTSPEPTSPETSSASTEATDTSATSDPATSDASDSTDDDVESRMDEARAALNDGDFDSMLRALELSGLADEIEDRQITILAPTEEAFADLPAGTVSDLLTNPTKVDEVLKGHIIDEVLTFDELAKKSTVTMLSGETLSVTADGGVVAVDGAVVTESDSRVSGEGGQDVAVFAVDRVLLDN